MGRDKAREIHSSLCNKALEYLTKEFTFYPKRASEMFKDYRVRGNNAKIKFVF